MKTAAFAHAENRIAPVFDTAREVRVVVAEGGQILSEATERLPQNLPLMKALRLVELGVGTLICGGISRELHGVLHAYGIHVIPFVAGELPATLTAWLNGTLEGRDFAMPGTYGRGRGRGRGGKGGFSAQGDRGMCVCPTCGHAEPHHQGMPCVEQICPKCGTPLTRQ